MSTFPRRGSSAGRARRCSNCGSPIHVYLAATPGLLRVRLGTLDTPFTERAQYHTFVSDKAPWDVIQGDLPHFEIWASKDVLVQAGTRQS